MAALSLGDNVEVAEFLKAVVERERLSGVDRIALVAWRGPGHVVGVVFDVGGRWIHAADYGDLDERDWQDVDVSEALVMWERR